MEFIFFTLMSLFTSSADLPQADLTIQAQQIELQQKTDSGSGSYAGVAKTNNGSGSYAGVARNLSDKAPKGNRGGTRSRSGSGSY
ncbi:hypothetical protein [Gilvibacter sediminis]|uniref:hypothetical protein n=1 Tax=Gilvibacter sediminis TaxID=379071 RepID=UPI002350F2AD|nr:hypothetical protein [Gilvibacter sediminis]MDC7997492.1 hypothetical protein [Gilvibacter sediminis]